MKAHAHVVDESASVTTRDPYAVDHPTELIRSEVVRLVTGQTSGSEVALLLASRRLDVITTLAEEDLLALAGKDPAAEGSWRQVWRSYAAYRATLAYRVAHAIYTADVQALGREHCRDIARRISEQAKVDTGAEIHPAATVGRRFVLDHGLCTVIGETTVIGDDAYVLQGVVLGARGIANNPSGRRHPRIGDRVQIGSFARVLGPVTVGDDVLVCPHAVITTDVPSHKRVLVFNQVQFTAGHCKVRVFGVVPIEAGVFEVHGTHLDRVRIDLLTSAHDIRPVSVLTCSDRLVRCVVPRLDRDDRLRLIHDCGAETLLCQPLQQWQEAVSAVVPDQAWR